MTITSAITSVRAARAATSSHAAQAVIDLGVIDRVEAGVGAIDRMEERQHVHASERTLQRPIEQLLQVAKRAARKAIDVGDQLCLILHPQARKG